MIKAYFDLDFWPALLALGVIPIILAIRHRAGRTPVTLVPYAGFWGSVVPRRRGLTGFLGLYVVLVLLIIAAAQPVRVTESPRERAIGPDVVLAIDLSTSMLAEDLAPASSQVDRLQEIKPTLLEFVSRPSLGRIGVVLFAGRASTLLTLSGERAWIRQQIADLRIGDLEDGTAIGDGLGLALSQFDFSSTTVDRQRAVVLLTDGANTSGAMTPPQAAAIARRFAVPVYAIAVGRDGNAPYPVFDSRGRRIGASLRPSSVDREMLRFIARETGGLTFEAVDRASLASSLQQIERAWTPRMLTERVVAREDLRPWFLWPALLGLALILAAALRGWYLAAPLSPKIVAGIIAGGQFKELARHSAFARWPWVMTAAGATLLVSMMLPSPSPRPVTSSRAEVIVAIDLSRSMDINEGGRSRIERVRQWVDRVVDGMSPQTAIGLIVFARKSHLVAPVSAERQHFRRALRELAPSDLEAQGTDFTGMLKHVAGAFSPQAATKHLLLISDGEVGESGWESSLVGLKANEIRIVAVGVGDPRTAPVPDGRAGWLRDSRGMFVYSTPQKQTLRFAAAATGGVFIDAASAAAIVAAVSTALQAPNAAARPTVQAAANVMPRSSLWLLLVILLLSIGAWRELPARPKLKAYRSARSALRDNAIAAALAGVALVVLGTVSADSQAQASRELRTLRSIQSLEERDALREVEKVVTRMLQASVLRADDYLELARVSASYGAIHRLHAHPISEGVLRDGLVAVAAGRALAPQRAEWTILQRELTRLLEPPPAISMDDGELDVANEPLEGRLAMGSPISPASPEGSGADRGDTDSIPSTNPGGGAGDSYTANEWQDASVALPLYLLREVQKKDSFALLFRALAKRRSRDDPDEPRSSQVW